ncbi:MAG: molecular chaperone HtpG [Myxococcota bacterium]
MTTTSHGFKAEVQQLLNLMIHSVYSDREVFVRELVSNAADALDKARFTGLTRSDLTATAHDDPAIRISADTEAKTLTIEDDGIGMTQEEVVQNLGTIAHSGTKAFMEQASEGDGPKLIGQFGLGFYSAFMVAEKVVVDTLSAEPGSEPVRWSSAGEGTYEVEPGQRQHRGTTIILHLREDATEFGQDDRIRGIVKRHSDFLPWPIFVGEEQANSGKALWVEPPSQIEDEDANQFYKSITMDWQEPVRRIHVSVDSPIQYHAMLFIPGYRPYSLFDPTAAKGPRLYARRVMIEEHASDLFPDWLRFVRGVVDSEDIALNVSREMVQKTPIVRKIGDALTKRVLKDLGKWAEAEPAEDTPENTTYPAFWRNFGVLLKEGYYHGATNWGEQLLPLLRFNALSHDDADGLTSLQQYREAMPPTQETIWTFAAESREAALASPHLEVFRKKGFDVLLLTDPVDEWLTMSLTEFDGMPIKSITRGELELDDEESSEEQGEKTDLTEFSPWVKELLGDAVSEVRESTRLTDSAVVLVDAEDGLSRNMERVLEQTQQGTQGLTAQRVLELNARHPLIKNLAALKANGQEDAAADLARMLYDEALLLEGSVKEPAAMGRRLQDLLVKASQAALD